SAWLYPLTEAHGWFLLIRRLSFRRRRERHGADDLALPRQALDIFAILNYTAGAIDGFLAGGVDDNDRTLGLHRSHFQVCRVVVAKFLIATRIHRMNDHLCARFGLLQGQVRIGPVAEAGRYPHIVAN